jgi:KamA family protein
MKTNRKVIKQFNELAKKENLLPIQVSYFFQQKIDEEIKAVGLNGPLYKSVYPTNEKIKLHVAGEVSDYVQDIKNSPKGLKDILVQKYEDRVLFLTTDSCLSHCQYCCRTDLLSCELQKQNKLPDFREKVKKTIDYINKHPKVLEIIFSGGDPMTVDSKLLDNALQEFTKQTKVREYRFHTKAIVYNPKIFTMELIKILSNHNVRLYFHIIHPYEIDETIIKTVNKLKRAGIKMYNQFPILRGINDHEIVLMKLLKKLDELGIRQIHMYVPEPLKYSASFRLPLERIFKIIDILNWHTPSWLNATKLILDSPIGKLQRQDIISWDKKSGLVTFLRAKKEFTYPDFPKKFDKPGKLQKMLWKG